MAEQKDYERFLCKRLDGTQKAVLLKIESMKDSWTEHWVPRSLCQLVKKPDTPGGDYIVDIETWFARQEIWKEE